MVAAHGGTMAVAMLAMAWISMAMPAAARAQGTVASETRGGGQRGTAIGAFRAQVLAADAALADGRAAEAQVRIGRAEAMLMNARWQRSAGRGGRVAVALEFARAANAHGDLAGARAALRPLLGRLPRGGALVGKA